MDGAKPAWYAATVTEEDESDGTVHLRFDDAEQGWYVLDAGEPGVVRQVLSDDLMQLGPKLRYRVAAAEAARVHPSPAPPAPLLPSPFHALPLLIQGHVIACHASGRSPVSAAQLVRGAQALTVVSAFMLLTPWALIPTLLTPIREQLDSQLVHLEPQAVLANACVKALGCIEPLDRDVRRMLQARAHVPNGHVPAARASM